MGLAGVGKSTIGESLSNKLRHEFGDTIWLGGDFLLNAILDLLKESSKQDLFKSEPFLLKKRRLRQKSSN